ncbi:MAG: hypothetical protein MUO95_03100 [Methanoregula sp.]|nr:hypothetical protein [Methanoregula sp.]
MESPSVSPSVPPTLDKIMRQCRAQMQGSGACVWQDAGEVSGATPYDATSIVAPATLLKTSSRTYMSHLPWCLHNEYLYYTRCDGTGKAYVDEINLTTSAVTSIKYYDGTEIWAGWGASLSWLEDRTLVITDSSTAYGDDSLSWIWYIDFDANTSTEILEVEWYQNGGDDEWVIDQVCVVKDSIGDLHIVAMGQAWLWWGGDNAYVTAVWHCNYTDTPNIYTLYQIQAPDPPGHTYPTDWAWNGSFNCFDIVNDDYVVMYSGVQFYNGGYLETDAPMATVFNISTTAINAYYIGFGYYDYPAQTYYHAVDRTNSKTYTMAIWDEYDQSPGPYYMHLFQFDPVTGSSVVTFTQEMTTYSWLWLFESPTNAYLYNLEDSTLYRCSDNQVMGTFSLPQDLQWSHNLLCSVIEDGSIYGELLWYLDGTSLKAVSLDGTNRVNLDLSASYTPLNHMELLHLVDKMMIIAYKDTSPQRYDFYLVSE